MDRVDDDDEWIKFLNGVNLHVLLAKGEALPLLSGRGNIAN